MQPIATVAFRAALDKTVGVDILLSGNSAVVSALAARNLAPHRRTQAIAASSAAATLLRVRLTVTAVSRLQFAHLKRVGAVLLCGIGVQLRLPDAAHEGRVKASARLWLARCTPSSSPTW